MIYDEAVIRAALETCRFCGDVVNESDDCPSPEAEGRCCSPILHEQDMHWEICSRCRGDGWLGGYPGTYTADDFEDYEAVEDYMGYRRACDDCAGAGKVKGCEPTPELDQLDREYWEDEAVSRMERMYGA